MGQETNNRAVLGARSEHHLFLNEKNHSFLAVLFLFRSKNPRKQEERLFFDVFLCFVLCCSVFLFFFYQLITNNYQLTRRRARLYSKRRHKVTTNNGSFLKPQSGSWGKKRTAHQEEEAVLEEWFFFFCSRRGLPIGVLQPCCFVLVFAVALGAKVSETNHCKLLVVSWVEEENRSSFL